MARSEHPSGRMATDLHLVPKTERAGAAAHRAASTGGRCPLLRRNTILTFGSSRKPYKLDVMIYRKTLVVLSMLGMLVIACGSDDLSSICDKGEECAKKSGTPFSKTQCENEAKAEKEKAETAGCEDQYSEYVDCILGMDLECGDSSQKVQAECGAKISAVEKCLQ